MHLTGMTRKIATLAFAAFASLAAAACTTPAYVSPVEVTRFTSSTPAELGMGTIAIEPGISRDEQSPDYAVYEEALAARLAGLGYNVVEQTARQTAVLDVARLVTPPDRRSPVSVGGGGAIGSYGQSVGLGIGIDLSGPAPDRVYTEVTVYIRPAEGGGNLWEGRANFTATSNSEFAGPALAADRAMSALFEGFPGRSGETVTVE